MKRILSLMLLLLIACPLFVACGNTPPATEPESTEGVKKPVMNIFQKSDPSEDDIINILMIGNSHCYYYADELVGLATAAGIKIRVSNVYHSGCIISQHYNWWKEGQSKYQFITHDANGRTVVEGANLEYCLKQANWDMISLQEAFSPNKAKNLENCFAKCEPYMKDLTAYLREQFPKSTLYWHQTWSYEVGYDKDNGHIDSPAAQEAHHQTVRTVSLHLCETYDLIRIPVGDAWQIARKNPKIGDVLCHKKGKVRVLRLLCRVFVAVSVDGDNAVRILADHRPLGVHTEGTHSVAVLFRAVDDFAFV